MRAIEIARRALDGAEPAGPGGLSPGCYSIFIEHTDRAIRRSHRPRGALTAPPAPDPLLPPHRCVGEGVVSYLMDPGKRNSTGACVFLQVRRITQVFAPVLDDQDRSLGFLHGSLRLGARARGGLGCGRDLERVYHLGFLPGAGSLRVPSRVSPLPVRRLPGVLVALARACYIRGETPIAGLAHSRASSSETGCSTLHA